MTAVPMRHVSRGDRGGDFVEGDKCRGARRPIPVDRRAGNEISAGHGEGEAAASGRDAFRPKLIDERHRALGGGECDEQENEGNEGSNSLHENSLKFEPEVMTPEDEVAETWDQILMG